MMLIDCPNCGARNVSEFRYGGEVNKRPPSNEVTSPAWAEYVFMRENPLGVLTEWWYHRAGCDRWFIAERHTKTYAVVKTYLWNERSAEYGIDSDPRE
jgi:sarcosine oxidase subunit delta